MIMTDFPAGTVLYRAHTPRWASRPASGAGAAAKGGRFNREGVEALYLSLEELTALREYQQTSPLLPPCTVCSYTVALRNLVDLRQLGRSPLWDELWNDWREDWRHLKFEQHIEPPTWVLSDMVRGRALPGLCFPARPMSTAQTSWYLLTASEMAIQSRSTTRMASFRGTRPVGNGVDTL